MKCVPNVFPEYAQMNSTELTKIGQKKTCAFLLVFIVSVALTAIFYARETTVAQITVNNPSFKNFNDITEYKPKCECSQTSISIDEFVDIQRINETFCSQAATKLELCSKILIPKITSG